MKSLKLATEKAPPEPEPQPVPEPEPEPEPVQPSECDVAACTCAGVNLKGMQHKLDKTTTADTQGYSYMISICGDIPAKSLPEGCKDAEHPAVVKYKMEDPTDCLEIGSNGPCKTPGVDGEPACGMTGMKTAAGVDLTWAYKGGAEYCLDHFMLSLTTGDGSQPLGPVSSSHQPGDRADQNCSYSAAWAALPKADDGSKHQWKPTAELIGACVGGTVLFLVAVASYMRCKSSKAKAGSLLQYQDIDNDGSDQASSAEASW